MRTVYLALILLSSLLISSVQAVVTPVISVNRGGVGISNAGYDFWPVSTNSSTSITYTIRNTGSIPLGVNTPVVIGSVSPGLSVSVSTQPTSPVAVAGTTTVVLDLTVGNVSGWSFTISIGNTDMNNPTYSWTVKSGTAKAELDVTFKRTEVLKNTSVQVGQADTCCAGSAYTFTLRNSGSAPLNCVISFPNGVGERSPSIGISSSPAAGVPFQVQPGVPFNVTIRVVSSLLIYDWLATVLFTNDDGCDSNDERAFKFRIFGNTDYHLGFGFVEEMRLSDSAGVIIEKGELYKVAPGSEVALPSSYTFSIINMHQDGTLTVHLPITFTAAGVNCSAIFSATPGATGDVIIPARVGCPFCTFPSATFTVAVTPTAAGPWSIPVRVKTDDGNDEPQFDFTITGTAIGTPDLSIRKGATTLITSGVLTTALSAPGFTNTNVFTLRNTGTGRILLCNTVPSSAAVNCTVAASGTMSALSLLPGNSTSYTIQSTPTALGAWSFDLSFTTSDPVPSPFVVTLTGTATAPVPELDVYYSSTMIPNGGTFNATTSVADRAIPYYLRMVNSATGPLTISAVAQSGPAPVNCVIAIAGALGVVPATDPSSAAPLTVTVTASAVGPWSAQLTITSDDADEGSYVVNLTGIAVKLEPQKDCGIGTGFSVLLLMLVAAIAPLTRRRR